MYLLAVPLRCQKWGSQGFRQCCRLCVGSENPEYEFELSFDVVCTEVRGVALDLHIYENGAWHRALWLRFYHTYKISPNCTCFYKINPDVEISACKQQWNTLRNPHDWCFWARFRRCCGGCLHQIPYLPKGWQYQHKGWFVMSPLQLNQAKGTTSKQRCREGKNFWFTLPWRGRHNADACSFCPTFLSLPFLTDTLTSLLTQVQQLSLFVPQVTEKTLCNTTASCCEHVQRLGWHVKIYGQGKEGWF